MLLTEWKFDAELDVAREEAFEKGFKKGFELGFKLGKQGFKNGFELGIFEGKKRIAKNMKAEGIDTNTIARLTGLTVDEVLHLA